jgi:tight adherence protein C
MTYFTGRVVGAVVLFGAGLAFGGTQSVLLLIGMALLGFCVEAGLPLDQAMMRVGEDLKYAHPELSEEFYLANLELLAGKPRPEALRNLADRTGVDDVRSLVSALIQTDRFGTSIAQALRIYSDALRTERRRRAEEQAAKTSVKMIIPLVVFALLPLFLVTLGPALIGLFRDLSPAVRK